ncbi:MAG: DUF4382 domain-containing protein [Methyloligellaceae bacterium]
MTATWRKVFGAGLVAMGLAVAIGPMRAEIPLRQLEVRVTDHKPGIADFKRLTVSLSRVAIHPKGAPRTSGWIVLVENTAPVDIVPLKDGRWEKLGSKMIPTGRYDAIRIQFAETEGLLHGGKRPTLLTRDTTVAANIDLSAPGPQSIVIDLFAENQTDHAPLRYAVKVKEVRPGAAPAGQTTARGSVSQ